MKRTVLTILATFSLIAFADDSTDQVDQQQSGTEQQGQPARAALPEVALTKIRTPSPKLDMKGKSLFILYTNSTMLTGLHRASLQTKGYRVAETAEDADLKAICTSQYAIGGALQHLLVPSKVGPQFRNAGPKGTSSDMSSILISAAVGDTTNTVTNLFGWIGKKAGIFGRTEEIPQEAITECPYADCRLRQTITIDCTGDIDWKYVYESVDERFVLNSIFAHIQNGYFEDIFPPLKSE